jgi:hypothetical protein
MQSSADEGSTPHGSYDSDATEGRMSPTQARRLEMNNNGQEYFSDPSASAFHTAISQQPGHRSRQSLSSLYAEVASIYYDAEIYPDENTETEGSHQASHRRAGSRGSFASVEVERHVEQAMRDLEEQDRMREVGDGQNNSRYSIDTVVPSSKAPVQHQAQAHPTPAAIQPAEPVSRRTGLPFPSPASEPSLIGMLRKNVGKDLSTITFDVTFNEPLSLLQ